MQPLQNENDDVIDLGSYVPEESNTEIPNEQVAEDPNEVIDLKEYTNSGEEQKASWADLAKDLIIQPALGAAAAFTWPLDILKLGMVGEALTDIDELEESFKKEGKPFDRSKYLQTVAEQSEFIPTQDFLERAIEDKTGISLEAKSDTGKAIRKFFTLIGLLKGKGITKEGIKKAAKGALAGTATTEGLKALGINETVSNIAGDLVAGGASALTKEPRVLAPEFAEIEKTAAKHGLPFPEYLTKESSELVKPRISQSRKAALQKELGMSSKEAIDEVISGKLPIQKLKSKGASLEVLKDEAYDRVTELSHSKPKILPTEKIVSDIDAEISRIKKLAPSTSDADKAAIGILEGEKAVLEKAKPNTEQLVNQIRNYNSNVKGIYRRPEFTGREDAVRSAYAFLNNSIRNTIEAESGPEIRQAIKAADSLNGDVAKLNRVESLVSKSFKDGDYNPKKLQSLLNSRQGLIVRRELGDQAVSEIRDIATYGERAVKATNQLAKSSKHFGDVAEWGPLAGMLLYKMPKTAGILLGAKTISDRVRGYLLTKPATRSIYKDIVKNAAKGSFKPMSKDFAKLESEIAKEYGSVQEFFKSMQDDLELVDD